MYDLVYIPLMSRGEEPSKVKEGLVRNQLSLGKNELSHIQKLDPIKYARLAARLITPGQLGGPCPLPSFSGIFIYQWILSILCRGNWNCLSITQTTTVKVRKNILK